MNSLDINIDRQTPDLVGLFRNYGELTKVENSEGEVYYEGDINGDGITDQFRGRITKGIATGEIRFFLDESNYIHEALSYYTKQGEEIQIGDQVALRSRNNKTYRIESFKVFINAASGGTNVLPETLYFGVQVLTTSGEVLDLQKCLKK